MIMTSRCYTSRTSKGTFCKHAIANGPGAHPVASSRRANGFPGLSNVAASGEFLLSHEGMDQSFCRGYEYVQWPNRRIGDTRTE